MTPENNKRSSLRLKIKVICLGTKNSKKILFQILFSQNHIMTKIQIKTIKLSKFLLIKTPQKKQQDQSKLFFCLLHPLLWFIPFFGFLSVSSVLIETIIIKSNHAICSWRWKPTFLRSHSKKMLLKCFQFSNLLTNVSQDIYFSFWRRHFLFKNGNGWLSGTLQLSISEKFISMRPLLLKLHFLILMISRTLSTLYVLFSQQNQSILAYLISQQSNHPLLVHHLTYSQKPSLLTIAPSTIVSKTFRAYEMLNKLLELHQTLQ